MIRAFLASLLLLLAPVAASAQTLLNPPISAGGTINGTLLFSPDNTYDIGANGANRPRNVFVGANLALSAGSSEIIFGTSARIDAPANNNITLSNTGLGTGFGLLQFGGTTSSFPALKRNATSINVRLADDTADAPMTASVFTGQTGISAASAGYHNWNSRSVMRSPADGSITLLNSAETSFGLLQFGGTTASFPALKRNGANVDVRLADDSAYTSLTAANFTAQGQVQTGATVVGSLPTCNAGNKGARHFVTDATATTFLSAVAGSGANNVPVVCDGTSWKIG